MMNALININYSDVVKCLIYYSIANSYAFVYNLVTLFQFEMMYGASKLVDITHVYVMVAVLCFVWVYETSFKGMGYNLLGKITNYPKDCSLCSYTKKLSIVRFPN